MKTEPSPSFEKPLSQLAKSTLISSASATILFFYLLSVASLLFIGALLGLELILVLALARFGLGGFMIPAMNHHVALMGVILRSFYNRKSTELRVTLTPTDAPGLFAALRNLSQRFELTPPQKVSLEMTSNAWVHLKGFRSGAGTTFLGIGYDLLAGLTQAEAEAVLAHEMAHAKLIQRGIRNWLFTSLSQITRLAHTLRAVVNGYQHAKQSCAVADGLLRWVDTFAKLLTHLVATYSRQEEFAADRGAAEVCGAAAIRSALTKLETISSIANRLPWRERVAQLQIGEGFSQWLVKELTTKNSSLPVENTPQLFDKYSTHPLLKDRLAALPAAADHFQMNREPAIAMLADPDAAAEKLISEVQRVIAAEEQKDTKQLKKLSRKARGTTSLRPMQLLGVFSGIAGFLILLFCLVIGEYPTMFLLLALAAGGLAVMFYMLGRYRDFIELPIPDYSILKQSFEKAKEVKNLEAAQKELEKELRQQADKQKSRSHKAQRLASECYSALKRCDYLRAHVAARLCLDMSDKKSVEGAMGLAIASAALGQREQVNWALQTVQKATGFKTNSTAWGGAWALVLSSGWEAAEALMEQARKEREQEPSLLMVLAVCQVNRGKLQSAILSARRACTPTPRNKEHAKSLINMLIQGGYLREARERLNKLEGQLRFDTDLMFSTLQVTLLQRNFVAAEEWVTLIKQHCKDAHTLVRLGVMYEGARKSEEAAAFYNEALAVGFYPEACLGLGRLSVLQQNKEQAQKHFLAALNLIRPLGEKSVGQLNVFHPVITELLMLNDPIPHCQAWIVRLNANASPAPLANSAFMIYAANKEDAEKYFRIILNAIRPGQAPLVPTIISWQEAPWQQKPDGIVRPGVQGALG